MVKNVGTTHIWVKQKRSQIGQTQSQRKTLLGLGLKRIGKERTLKDTPAIRGMIHKVQHLVEVQVRAGDVELSGARSRKNA